MDWQCRIHSCDSFYLIDNDVLKNAPDLVSRILLGRTQNFQSPIEVSRFLSPSLKNLKDPFAIDQMHLATERTFRAFTHQEKICLYGDFDLDGTSGLALLMKGLSLLGYKNFFPYQPKRLTEGYGLHRHAIENFFEQGVSLVVTVDVGITSHEAIDRANALGIDVIVTDHHLPAETLPSAFAVLNPNKGSCSSNLNHLCGAGVAFYFLLALRKYFREKNCLTTDFDPKKLLDCFAIGTLTDLVPLVEENRVLVRHGLRELADTERPGLRLLLEKLGLKGRPLTSQEVAIRFAPKLNALSRMELDILPLDLFLVPSEDSARSLVEQVISNNEMRLELQARAERVAQDLATKQIQNHQNYLWVWSAEFHQGVIGLVATKLAQKYGLPAFVGSLNKKNQKITGSARSPNGSPSRILLALQAATDCLEKFGGHAAAAGFELKSMNVELFHEKLKNYFSSCFVSDGYSKTQQIFVYDTECLLCEVNSHLMNWLGHLEPFGTSWEPISLRINSLIVKNWHHLRGGHLKFEVQEQNSPHQLSAIWFSPPTDHSFLLDPKSKIGERVDILGEPQWNYFAGKKNIQLIVKDIRFSC